MTPERLKALRRLAPYLTYVIPKGVDLPDDLRNELENEDATADLQELCDAVGADPDRAPVFVQRTDAEIEAELDELVEIIQWHRYQARLNRYADGETPPPGERSLAEGRVWAKAIEKKHGKDALLDYAKTDFDWGLTTGRFSALQWLSGCEWDESMDT